MQISINIENESVAKKILWLLTHFKDEGVEVKYTSVPKEPTSNFSEEYLKEHWQELIMTNEDPYVSDDDMLEKAHSEWDNEKYHP